MRDDHVDLGMFGPTTLLARDEAVTLMADIKNAFHKIADGSLDMA